MRRRLRTLLALCVAATLPCCASAQKKGGADPKASDRQKLADAYAVLTSMATHGLAIENAISSREDHEVLASTAYKQVNVAVDRKACLIGWDQSLTTSDKYGQTEDGRNHATKAAREVVLLAKIDIRSMRVVPFDPAREGNEKWSYTYDGFFLTWSYLDLEWRKFDVPASINPDGKKPQAAQSLYLATQEDADRAMKALAYLAKSCGAHETAF